jgi:hypothetical protein
MANDGREFGRLTNDKPLRFYTRDNENTINLHPLEYFPHKALTASLKVANM